MLGLTVVTPPTLEPITLEEAKENLRFPYDHEELRIRSLIKAAREFAENYTGRALMTQTLRLTLDCFPRGIIRLPRPPLQTLTADEDNPDLGISYVDTAGVSQDLVLGTDYRVDAYSEPGRIEPVDTWPVTDDRLGAVTVIYLAGYTTAALVPERVKQAMHLLISHWFTNREPVGQGQKIALSVDSLLNSAWSGSMVGTFP